MEYESTPGEILFLFMIDLRPLSTGMKYVLNKMTNIFYPQ